MLNVNIRPMPQRSQANQQAGDGARAARREKNYNSGQRRSYTARDRQAIHIVNAATAVVSMLSLRQNRHRYMANNQINVSGRIQPEERIYTRYENTRNAVVGTGTGRIASGALAPRQSQYASHV